MKPIYITKTYDDSIPGKRRRHQEEEKLISDGYILFKEEKIKEWNIGLGCCLALLFLPLALFARMPKIRVTYQLNEHDISYPLHKI